jgi:hypothetical protein
MRHRFNALILVLAAAVFLPFCPAAFGQKANSDIQRSSRDGEVLRKTSDSGSCGNKGLYSVLDAPCHQ